MVGWDLRFLLFRCKHGPVRLSDDSRCLNAQPMLMFKNICARCKCIDLSHAVEMPKEWGESQNDNGVQARTACTNCCYRDNETAYTTRLSECCVKMDATCVVCYPWWDLDFRAFLQEVRSSAARLVCARPSFKLLHSCWRLLCNIIIGVLCILVFVWSHVISHAVPPEEQVK